MDQTSRIYVAGHRGLAGSAIVRSLRGAGYERLIVRTRSGLDLRDREAVDTFFAAERPEYVFLAAAKVGGILANESFPGDFIRDNLLIQTNVIDAAYRYSAQKLLFLGSSCIYPKYAPQPMAESCLMSGGLEPTNSAYAIAKIAGIEMCRAYQRQYGFDCICLMPTNLYGPGDNFDLKNSHVLPALIRKFHEAKSSGSGEVVVWGTGSPRREFLFADDLAEAAVFLMNCSAPALLVNVGVGEDISIRGLADLIGEIVGFEGDIRYDTSKPDGTPRKLLDVSLVKSLGWQAKTPLREGVLATYRAYAEGAA